MGFKIGNIEIKNRIVMAPMAGISNAAYMKICEEMGVGYAVTELISSEAIIRNNKKTFEMLNGLDTLSIPVAVQLFGADCRVMAEAAKILVDKFHVKIIDVNMGCPVPKVAVRAEAGSCLLKDLSKVYEMVKTIVDNVDALVTVKIRSGWDANSINAVEVAKEVQKAGASAICVHPRTRSQGYSGKADWSIIKQVKENVSIPVIGNGDVKSCYDVKKMLDETNCDAVMIGRALLGNPWLIKNSLNFLQGKPLIDVSMKERISILKKHLNYLVEFKGEKIACLEIRNHVAWYFSGIAFAHNIKNKVYQTSNIHDIIKVLDELEDGSYE